MGTITVRNIPDEVHAALRTLADKHGRSAEAEVRALIAAAVAPELGAGLGQEMRKLWDGVYGDDFESLRDQEPAEGASFK